MNEKYPCNDVGSIVLFLVVLGCFCWLLSITGCGSSAKDNTDTIRTVEQLKGENQSARSEVESGQRHLGHAEVDLGKATDAVIGSEEAAIESARGTEQLQALIGECQGIIKEEQRIIREVDEANRAGAEKDKAH